MNISNNLSGQSSEAEAANQYFVSGKWSANAWSVVFGGLSLFANLLLFCFMLTDFKKLFLKWPTIAFLIIGNIGNASHAVCNGIYRLILVSWGIYDDPYTIIGCFWVGATSFLIIGFVMPSMVQCCIAIERIVAITRFNWYRTNWSNKKMWYAMIGMLSGTVCCWYSVGWYIAFSTPRKVSRGCGSPEIFGIYYCASLYFFGAFSGTFSALVNLSAVVVGQMRLSKMETTASNRSQFKNQFRLARTMFIVAFVDFCLVAIPSFLLILLIGFGWSMPASLGSSAGYTICVYSTANIVICVYFNSEIRGKIVSCGKKFVSKCRGNEVTPLNGGFGNSQKK